MSIEAQFATAVSQCAAAGVPVRFNDESLCCQGCYVANDPNEVFALSQDGAIEFYHGAAFFVTYKELECVCDEYDEEDEDYIDPWEVVICEKCLGKDVLKISVRIGAVYFYYRNPESARIFNDVMTRNGIRVEWSGDPSRAVEVLLNG